MEAFGREREVGRFKRREEVNKSVLKFLFDTSHIHTVAIFP